MGSTIRPPLMTACLLGLKGTMSEAELHVLRARLRGGVLHKASRAALKLPLPVGLVYTEDDTVVLHPDAQIQHALRLLFATFQRTGSAWATVKYFRAQGLLFPRRVRTGPHAGTIHWMALGHNAVLKALRNPRYAGAFCYGRTHTTKHPDGSLHIQTLPQEQWLVSLLQGRPCGLPELGGVRGQSAAVARQCAGQRPRASAWPAAGRARLAPRVAPLRALWQPDDRALPLPRARG